MCYDTPGRGKIVPRKYIMFDYLAMACKDSDYIAVITSMHCPHHTILVLKLTLVVEIQAFL